MREERHQLNGAGVRDDVCERKETREENEAAISRRTENRLPKFDRFSSFAKQYQIKISWAMKRKLQKKNNKNDIDFKTTDILFLSSSLLVILNRGGSLSSLLSISALTSSFLTTLVIGPSASAVRFLAGMGISFFRDSAAPTVADAVEGLALVTVTPADSTLECQEVNVRCNKTRVLICSFAFL